MVQMAWVVKNVEQSKTFFQEMLGVTKFSPTFSSRQEDYD